MWLLTSCVFKVLISFLVIELLLFQAWRINLKQVKTKELWRRGQHLSASIMFLFFARAFLKRCLASVHAKKIALAYSPCQTRRIIKWLAIGLSQSSYRFYSMLATFALKDYRLVAPNRAKSMELSFYTVDDAMLVELQSSKLVDQISEI